MDRVYMTFVQATTGSGGWPMSVWLTPELKPFYGGTYFPPASRWGTPGFIDVLEEIARVWRDGARRTCSQSADATARAAPRASPRSRREAGEQRPPGARTRAPRSAPSTAVRSGLRRAPWRLRRARRSFRGRASCCSCCASTPARATAPGRARHGAGDAAGDGDRRHARPPRRRLPSLLGRRATGVCRISRRCSTTRRSSCSRTSKPRRRVARRSMRRSREDTLEYVRRDMTDPTGGFYSAEDADSVPPEHGGRRRTPERRRGPSTSGPKTRCASSSATTSTRCDGGSASSPGAMRRRIRRASSRSENLLYVARSIEDVRPIERTIRRARSWMRWAEARRLLFEARAKRPRPHLDDKMLTAWNGLMIAAFARAARDVAGRLGRGSAIGGTGVPASRAARGHVHPRPPCGTLRPARCCADIARAMRQSTAYCRRLRVPHLGAARAVPGRRRSRVARLGASSCSDGRTSCSGTRSEAAGSARAGADPSVLLRLKEDYDGAEPSASSISVHESARARASDGRSGRDASHRGHVEPLQRPIRPAWSYRTDDGGGVVDASSRRSADSRGGAAGHGRYPRHAP